MQKLTNNGQLDRDGNPLRSSSSGRIRGKKQTIWYLFLFSHDDISTKILNIGNEKTPLQGDRFMIYFMNVSFFYSPCTRGSLIVPLSLVRNDDMKCVSRSSGVIQGQIPKHRCMIIEPLFENTCYGRACLKPMKMVIFIWVYFNILGTKAIWIQ